MYDWNWNVLFELSPGGDLPYWKTLAEGTVWTVSTAISAVLIALLAGVPLGAARTMPRNGLVKLCDLYVEFFRNIPLLVQLFLWFFVVPELLPMELGDSIKTAEYSSFLTSVVCLGLFTSARIAEQFKSGINSLPRGQLNAGLALGLTRLQAYRLILVPQALRLIVPPLTSEMINLVKNTSVALTIGLVELTSRTRAMQEFSFRIFEAFTVATLIYLVLNGTIVLAMGRVERHFRQLPGQKPTGSAK